MLLQIGAKPEAGFDEPIGILTDCHKRIREFLRAMVIAAKNPPARPFDEHELARVRGALRYFRVSGPKHSADEEESLFPRMRQMNSAPVNAALDVVDRIEEEHRYAEAKQLEVARLFEGWMENGSIPEADHEQLNSILAELTGHYDQHITTEEQKVFPAAAEMLTPADEEAIGKEMAARRGVPFRPALPQKRA